MSRDTSCFVLTPLPRIHFITITCSHIVLYIIQSRNTTNMVMPYYTVLNLDLLVRRYLFKGMVYRHNILLKLQRSIDVTLEAAYALHARVVAHLKVCDLFRYLWVEKTRLISIACVIHYCSIILLVNYCFNLIDQTSITYYI